MRGIRSNPHSIGYFGSLPSTTLAPYRGPETTLNQMVAFARGEGGERSMIVRQFVEFFLRGIQPKDYLGEIIAIRNIFVQPSPFIPGGNTPLFRYMNDPRHVEMVKTPERCVREIMEHGSTLVDCDDISVCAGTFALHCGREVEFVALGFAPNTLSHVGVRVKEPKSGRWIWLDGVAGPREKEAAGRAKTLLIKSLD